MTYLEQQGYLPDRDYSIHIQTPYQFLTFNKTDPTLTMIRNSEMDFDTVYSDSTLVFTLKHSFSHAIPVEI